MQFINDDNESSENNVSMSNNHQENPNHSRSNGTFLKHSGQLAEEYRKKSQSSADSPTALFHNNNNKKKNIKKLIIQETLEDPNSDLLADRDNSSINT